MAPERLAPEMTSLSRPLLPLCGGRRYDEIQIPLGTDDALSLTSHSPCASSFLGGFPGLSLRHERSVAWVNSDGGWKLPALFQKLEEKLPEALFRLALSPQMKGLVRALATPFPVDGKRGGIHGYTIDVGIAHFVAFPLCETMRGTDGIWRDDPFETPLTQQPVLRIGF